MGPPVRHGPARERFPAQEERLVAPNRGRGGEQLLLRRGPDRLQQAQRRRRVGAAAAKPTGRGELLVDRYVQRGHVAAR